MAAQTLLPEIGIYREGGIFFDLFGCRCGRQLFGYSRKTLRLFFGKGFHIFFIGFVSEPFMWVGIFAAEVGIGVVVPVLCAKPPERAVDFPLFGRHEVIPLCRDLFWVAHTAGIFVDPRTTGIGIEGFGTFVLFEVCDRAFVCGFFLRSVGITAMADDTVITSVSGMVGDLEDLLHHA